MKGGGTRTKGGAEDKRKSGDGYRWSKQMKAWRDGRIHGAVPVWWCNQLSPRRRVPPNSRTTLARGGIVGAAQQPSVHECAWYCLCTCAPPREKGWEIEGCTWLWGTQRSPSLFRMLVWKTAASYQHKTRIRCRLHTYVCTCSWCFSSFFSV